MRLQPAPEVADGGYWYVVPVVTDGELGGQTPGDVPGPGWCAWYHGDLVAIRCPGPIAGLDAVSEPAATVLMGAGFAGKPIGRIGGR